MSLNIPDEDLITTNYDDVSDLNGAATSAVLTAAENATPYVPFIKNEILAANNKTSPLISQKHPEHFYNSKLTEKYLVTTNYDDTTAISSEKQWR
ncbi:5682_t:CDS:2 [Racocetra fulgida]|uniref:5682_t:CDS:1 n=1 Tax=Racocetra fulgida TaxID=60492 RepID=A0A9N8VG93_9GLOM|nr:5682_t:CDS:2 [Racocetra fulgida]